MTKNHEHRSRQVIIKNKTEYIDFFRLQKTNHIVKKDLYSIPQINEVFYALKSPEYTRAI